MSAGENPQGVIRRTVSDEPVAVAGVVRALVYSLLGSRGLDPSTLALIVVTVESVVSFAVRRLVSPVDRATPPAAGTVADQEPSAMSTS